MPIDLTDYYPDWQKVRELYQTNPDLSALKTRMEAENFDDSKQVQERDRELFKQSIDACRELKYLDYAFREISALEISDSMNREERVNLNLMSFRCVVELIRELLGKGLNVKRVFVDTVGSPEKYKAFLEGHFPNHGNRRCLGMTLCSVVCLWPWSYYTNRKNAS